MHDSCCRHPRGATPRRSVSPVQRDLSQLTVPPGARGARQLPFFCGFVPSLTRAVRRGPRSSALARIRRGCLRHAHLRPGPAAMSSPCPGVRVSPVPPASDPASLSVPNHAPDSAPLTSTGFSRSTATAGNSSAAATAWAPARPACCGRRRWTTWPGRRSGRAGRVHGALTPTGPWCEDAWLTTAMLVAAHRAAEVPRRLPARVHLADPRRADGRDLPTAFAGTVAAQRRDRWRGAEQRAYGDFLDKDERYAADGGVPARRAAPVAGRDGGPRRRPHPGRGRAPRPAARAGAAGVLRRLLARRGRGGG